MIYLYYMATRLPLDIYDHGLIDGIKYTHNMYYAWRCGYGKLFRCIWPTPRGNNVVTTKNLGGGAVLVIEKHANGEEYHEYINQYGELHREDGPAWLLLINDKLIVERYYLRGVRHSKEEYVMQGGKL